MAMGLPGMRMSLGKPLDEFPVFRPKKLLFVGGAGCKVHEVVNAFELFAGAWALELELDRQTVPRRVLLIRFRPAKDAQSGARRVEMGGPWWKEPPLKVFDQLLLVRGFFYLRKPVQIAVGGQLGGQGAFRAQKEERNFLQS